MMVTYRGMVRALVVALAGAGLASHVQAATYTVPPGTTQLTVTLNGAGGGAGGADLGGAAGPGAAGTQLVVTFNVQPGDVVTYEVGSGGASGTSWDKLPNNSGANAAGMAGGAGGAGYGGGGAGGAGPLANASYSRPQTHQGPTARVEVAVVAAAAVPPTCW